MKQADAGVNVPGTRIGQASSNSHWRMHMAKNQRGRDTSDRVGKISSKWANRLKKNPKQQRFNVGRSELRAMAMSNLNQRG